MEQSLLCQHCSTSSPRTPLFSAFLSIFLQLFFYLFYFLLPLVANQGRSIFVLLAYCLYYKPAFEGNILLKDDVFNVKVFLNFYSLRIFVHCILIIFSPSTHSSCIYSHFFPYPTLCPLFLKSSKYCLCRSYVCVFVYTLRY